MENGHPPSKKIKMDKIVAENEEDVWFEEITAEEIKIATQLEEVATSLSIFDSTAINTERDKQTLNRVGDATGSELESRATEDLNVEMLTLTDLSLIDENNSTKDNMQPVKAHYLFNRNEDNVREKIIEKSKRRSSKLIRSNNASSSTNLQLKDEAARNISSDEPSAKKIKLDQRKTYSIEDRKNFKLSLISPGGKLRHCDVVANLNTFRDQNEFAILNPHCNDDESLNTDGPDEYNFPVLNLDVLRESLETDSMWEIYDTYLTDHVSFLQNFRVTTHNESDLTQNESSDNSTTCNSTICDLTPVCASNVNRKHHAVSQLLKNLVKIFELNCPKKKEPLQRKEPLDEEMWSSSAPLFGTMDIGIEEIPCLVPLLTLTNGSNYPDEYNYKLEEILLALNALHSWSLRSPANIIVHVMYHLPLKSLLSSEYGFPYSLITIQILNNLVGQPYFEMLLHRTKDTCPFVLMANMCHIMDRATQEEYSPILREISSFVFSCIAHMGNQVFQFGSCPCSAEIIQGLVLMLYEYFNLCEEHSDWDISTLEKGVLILHQLSLIIYHFRRKRYPVEDTYIVLIERLLWLASENEDISHLKDPIMELIDFRDVDSE